MFCGLAQNYAAQARRRHQGNPDLGQAHAMLSPNIRACAPMAVGQSISDLLAR